MIVADFQEVVAGRTPEVAVSESPGTSVEETWKQGWKGHTGRTPRSFLRASAKARPFPRLEDPLVPLLGPREGRTHDVGSSPHTAVSPGCVSCIWIRGLEPPSGLEVTQQPSWRRKNGQGEQFSNRGASDHLGVFLTCQFGSVGLGWGLRICISNKGPAADAFAPQTHANGECVGPPLQGRASWGWCESQGPPWYLCW